MERAYQRSDASYDGVFYLGVRTTGIFCRPSCPARKPKPENVEFFAMPKEALFAGYRPRLRCRPLEGDEAPPWVARLLQRVEGRPDTRIRERDLRTMGSSPRGSAAISPLATGSPSRRTVGPAGSHRHSSTFATDAQWTMRCSRPDTSRIAGSVRHSRRLSASHRDGRPRATASDSPGSTRQWGRWLPAPPTAGCACSSSPIGGCSSINS